MKKSLNDLEDMYVKMIMKYANEYDTSTNQRRPAV